MLDLKLDKELIETVKKSIRKDLKMDEPEQPSSLEEAYVVSPAKQSLSTELLSQKTKTMLKDRADVSAEALNRVSAELDSVDRDNVNPAFSRLGNLKSDELRLINENFLLGMHMANISDPNSVITMDSLAFLRLERDFGTFDAWQKDFIACALAASSGYIVTAYNSNLKRYMNFIADADNRGLPLGTHPVISLCVCGDAYIRDYLGDRKTYVFAMMKEFSWGTIEERFKKTEKIAKVLK